MIFDHPPDVHPRLSTYGIYTPSINLSPRIAQLFTQPKAEILEASQAIHNCAISRASFVEKQFRDGLDRFQERQPHYRKC